jgi:glyceraldehyde 3-phosphate dehydrogenase
VLKDAAEKEMKGVMAFSEEPLVSADIIGEPYSSIVDGLSTMVLGNRGRTVKVLSWYDNEWGFACRLVDLIRFVGSKMI